MSYLRYILAVLYYRLVLKKESIYKQKQLQKAYDLDMSVS
jgi:hypothetical protein